MCGSKLQKGDIAAVIWIANCRAELGLCTPVFALCILVLRPLDNAAPGSDNSLKITVECILLVTYQMFHKSIF
jgi:hypothetical protein